MKSKSDDSEVSDASLESDGSAGSGSDPDDQSHLLAGDYRPSIDQSHLLAGDYRPSIEITNRKQVETGPAKRENQFLSSRQFGKVVENV